MDELLSTVNRAAIAFFSTWVNPAAFVLMLGVTARVWLQGRKAYEREVKEFRRGFAWGYDQGYEDHAEGRARREV